MHKHSDRNNRLEIMLRLPLFLAILLLYFTRQYKVKIGVFIFFDVVYKLIQSHVKGSSLNTEAIAHIDNAGLSNLHYLLTDLFCHSPLPPL